MKVLGLIEKDLDVVSKEYVDNKVAELKIPYTPKVLSESEYNQLNEKDPQTIYFIKED